MKKISTVTAKQSRNVSQPKLTIGLDLGGTRRLKFVLYLAFFASISSSAVFSSRLSCSGMLRRLRK